MLQYEGMFSLINLGFLDMHFHGLDVKILTYLQACPKLNHSTFELLDEKCMNEFRAHELISGK